MKNTEIRGTALGQAIKRFRRINGLTQADFADRAGVTVNTVHSWETASDSRPSVSSTDMIASILEIPVSDALEMSRMPAEEDPVLVIMAAGMGSRYGGLKQLDRLNEDGDIIIDFSIYDAIMAGFKKVVFIIRKEHEEAFEEAITAKIRPFADVEYAFQDMNDIPEEITVPEGRKKPWGTGQAILACRDTVKGPFLVINADDYYGRDAFVKAYDFLSDPLNSLYGSHMMIGYEIQNTITENGSVSRGVCRVDENDCLIDIKERKKIEKRPFGQAFLEDDGETWSPLDDGTPVSMNMFGLQSSIFDILDEGFLPFLREEVKKDPLKSEYLLPEVVGKMIKDGKGSVRVLKTAGKWFGVTYREDKENVVKAVEALKKDGTYPEHLWQVE
ncbi:MAG: XRE family transcriptional regulator [Lachnospiraceae bacterium]|nr:XRE family transcriptional regulator [Lachnospiraceae bacterium]